MTQPPLPAQAWLAARGWQPFQFQRDVWHAIAQGASGMLHATTGSGNCGGSIRAWWCGA